MNDKIFYAAYGINLDTAHMSIRCPGAEVYGKAELKDHELVFRGNPKRAEATVEPQTGSTVPVLLWKISNQHEKSLDQYTGWPVCYRKRMMEFEMENQTVSAMIYVMTPGNLPGYPSWQYFDSLTASYLECGFDPAVLGRAMDRSGELMRLAGLCGK